MESDVEKKTIAETTVDERVLLTWRSEERLYKPRGKEFYSTIVVLAFFILCKTNRIAGPYIIGFLLVWFPIEAIILKYTPPDFYALVKYTPEAVAYLLVGAGWIDYMRRTNRVFDDNLADAGKRSD